MPTITVHENGTQLYYIDSGPIEGRVYTTIVIVHGNTFHGGIFGRLFPLAASNGLRLVALNRRDYIGSTLYSNEELNVLNNGGRKDHLAFMQDRGVEILMFLERFVQEHSIPEAAEDGSKGGLALMGWSVGVAMSLAAIAAAVNIPLDTSQRLAKYMRSNILFDPTWHSLGLVDPPKYYLPLYDPTIPPEQRGRIFIEWVSGYFTHPDPSPETGTLDTLEYVSAYKGTDPTRVPSIHRISPSEYSTFMDFEPGLRSEGMYVRGEFQRENLEAQAHDALFNSMVKARWPRMRTALLLCENSSWTSVYAALELLKRSRVQASSGGSEPLRFIFLKQANHFVHLDEPERAIQAFVDCLEG